jgi:hypothetical protein
MAAAVSRLQSEVLAELDKPRHRISLRIHPNGDMVTDPSKLAEAAFQAYEPSYLGVIEYHSASRSYSRQAVGGLNLDVRAFEDQQRQSRLYNWQNKYQNVKTELASSYLRNLIARESGNPAEADDLNATLSELFQTFFPDKAYDGVRPQVGGSLDFPVLLSSGERHDIDELSSGEKEILYGYLKLRTSTPKHSVILLDEPELHLNPSLIQGFADFYYRHLGVAQDNQLWLITHSDSLLRQAVGNINYRVYQMLPALSMGDATNQAAEILADDDVERATIALVGDLASYRPNGKVVILEGKAEHGFDVTMVKRLFPDLARYVNLASGGHKQRVRDLYTVLSSPSLQSAIKSRFFAVVDRDSDPPKAGESGAAIFAWDAYHIENYLLDPGCIRAATATLLGRMIFSGDDELLRALRDCAEELIDSLVIQQVQGEVNNRFVEAINIGGDPHISDPAACLMPSIQASTQRLSAVSAILTSSELERMAQSHRTRLSESLASEAWLKDFPGRLILRRYVNRYFGGKIDSLLFANAVLDKMVEYGIRPPGMEQVLQAIVDR